MKKNCIVIAVALICVACSKQMETDAPVSPNLSTTPDGVLIPEDYKLTAVNVSDYVEFQATAMNVPTRALSGMEIKAIRRSDIAFGIQSKSIAEDTMMYVVNFAGNQGGYMVISNDMRVPMIAFSDEGSIDALDDNPGIKVLMQNYDCFVNASM